MNKKGLSDVITTVLIVLISLVAVAVVWGIVSNFMGSAETNIAKSQACLTMSTSVKRCANGTAGSVNLTIERGAGAVVTEPTKMKLIFEKTTGGETVSVDYPSTCDIPKELETKICPNVASTIAGGPKSVSISLGILGADGAVGYCNPTPPVSCN